MFEFIQPNIYMPNETFYQYHRLFNYQNFPLSKTISCENFIVDFKAHHNFSSLLLANKHNTIRRHLWHIIESANNNSIMMEIRNILSWFERQEATEGSRFIKTFPSLCSLSRDCFLMPFCDQFATLLAVVHF